MFPYIGTKKHETKHINQYLPPINDIKKVYDLFAGSASVAKFLAETYPTIDNFYINDILPIVNELHKVVLSGNNGIEAFVKDCEELNSQKTFEELQAKLRKFDMDDISPENVKLYYILSKRKRNPHLLDNSKKETNFKTIIKDNKNLPFNKFTASRRDYKEILQELEALTPEEQQGIFVYLDPPYLTSTNISRDDGICSREAFETDEMVFIADIMKRKKLKIMLNVGNNGFYKLIFGDMIKFIYPKTYSISKNKVEHVIITNY